MSKEDAMHALQNAFWQAGEQLMYRHTNPWELDEALCGWGYGVGPCEAQDLIGLDKVLARASDRAVPILPRMVAEGRMGKAGGVGYYRYPGGGGPVIDPLIEDLILEEAWFGKVERSELADDVLVQRMNAALLPVLTRLRGKGWKPDHLAALLHKAVHFPLGRSLPVL